jgi:hypothetical protein
MALSDDVSRIASAARTHATADETVAAVLVAETPTGERTYICAFTNGSRTWLALDEAGAPILSRDRVREAVSVAALHEVAVDATSDTPEEPRVATFASLDELGTQDPDVARAIGEAMASVDELAREVESNYKLELD